MQLLEQPQLDSVTKAASLRADYKSPLLSRFCAAILAFLLLNAILAQSKAFRFNPFDYPSKGWTWWLIKDLKDRGGQFNIALFGSSLMMSAVTSCDSQYLRQALPANNHRSADYLESKLKAKFKGSFRTFNFATPGQMPSDACLLLRALLFLGHKPDVIVYGLAPRDFIDNTLAEPSDTEPFEYLKRIVQTDDLADHLYDSWINRLSFSLENSLFLCRYAPDIKMRVWSAMEKLLATVVPRFERQPPFTCWDRIKLLPDYKPMENSAYTFREFHGSNYNEMAFDHWSTDNTQDYVQRYRYPNEHGFSSQCYFLKALTETCKQKKIELILVNMPLSASNIALFTSGRYARFLSRLQDFANANHIVLYNFCDTKRYPDSSFRDSVHLNALGGRQLFDQLSDRLSNDTAVNYKCVISGQQFAQQRRLSSTNSGGI